MQIRKVTMTSSNGNNYQVLLLNCSICKKEIKRSPSYKSAHTGIRCKSCTNRVLKSKEKTECSVKICKVCHQNLSISKFSKSKGMINHFDTCIKCYNLKKFGINAIDYLRILEKQGNKCAICNTSERPKDKRRPEGIRDFPVDHCHRTGKIRGILCTKCNTGLGAFMNNKILLKRAINYLEL